MKLNKEIRETIILLIVAVVIFLAMRYSVQTYVVFGPSMEPNYTADEWVIVNKLEYKFGRPERGDVAVLWSPYNQNTRFIKRIIGLPGESVEVKKGVVYIYTVSGDKIALNEPYIKYIAAQDFPKTLVPEGQYFVMGDNRNNSEDSRHGWTITRNKLIGKAWLDIWPPSRWGLAPNHMLPGATANASSQK